MSMCYIFYAWINIYVVAGTQFQLHTSPLPYDETHGACAQDFRVMAKVDTIEDQAWVETLKPYTDDYFLIGLKRDSDREPFVWHDGSQPEWTNWAPGFPTSDQHCVVMRPSDFKWETSHCSRATMFLCEDETYKLSPVVTQATRLEGLLTGLGVFTGLLVLGCVLLQTACCRHGVTMKIANLGFGKRSPDTNGLVI